jgi:hypothetical protein
MSTLLATLLVSLATVGLNAPAAALDNGDLPYVHIAQRSAGSAGPVAAPGGRVSKPNPFPSSSAAGGSEGNLNRNEEYSAAIRNCEALPRSQRRACINETKKKFGQM